MKELIGIAIFCIIFVMAIVYFSPKTCLIQRSGIESFADVPTVDSCPAGTYSYVTRTGNTQCCSNQPNGTKCEGKVVCTMSGEGNTEIPKCRKILHIIGDKQFYVPLETKKISSVDFPHDYTFQFMIKINERSDSNWRSIFRFTSTNKDCCSYGDRVLAGWIIPNTSRLHIRIGDTRDGNWGVDTIEMPLGHWVGIKIVAKGANVKLYLDGVLYQNKNMPSGERSRYSGNVSFHLPDKRFGYKPAAALVKNMSLQ